MTEPLNPGKSPRTGLIARRLERAMHSAPRSVPKVTSTELFLKFVQDVQERLSAKKRYMKLKIEIRTWLGHGEIWSWINVDSHRTDGLERDSGWSSTQVDGGQASQRDRLRHMGLSDARTLPPVPRVVVFQFVVRRRNERLPLERISNWHTRKGCKLLMQKV